MKITSFSFLILLLWVPCYTHACSCVGETNLCATVSVYPPHLTALAVKKADYDHGMLLEILEIIKGSESRQQVLVWGDNGFLCRHYTAQWSIGDTVIFNLYLIGLYPALPQEDSTDYQIGVCSVNYLNFSGSVVTGPINGTQTTMSYADFKNTIRACGATSLPESKEFPALKIFPNPAHGVVHISIDNVNKVDSDFRLFSINGAEIVIDENMISTAPQSLKLSTEKMAPGIYILEMRVEEEVFHRKLVIQ